MKDKKTVLIICPFSRPNIGGVETHLDKLQQYLSRENYYSVLLTYQPLSTHAKGQKLEKGENYEIHRMQWFGVGLFDQLETKFPLVFIYVFPALFLQSLFYYIRHHKEIDVIHAHGLVAAAIGALLKIIIPKRAVISTHAIYMFENRKSILRFVVKNVLSFYDKIIAVSQVSKDELVNMGILEQKIVCFKNWVDTDRFKPLSKNEIIMKSGESVNFLYVSRFIEKKGVLLYLKAAEAMPNANFYIVGGGQLEDQVTRAEKQLKNLKYFGVLNPDRPDDLTKLIDLYNLSDYFVSPYLYDEGYSTTLLEAVCSGTKVVIPRRGSPPTFLDETVAEFMPAEIDEQILISKLTDLSSRPKNAGSIKVCRDFGLKNLGFSNAKVILDTYAS